MSNLSFAFPQPLSERSFFPRATFPRLRMNVRDGTWGRYVTRRASRTGLTSRTDLEQTVRGINGTGVPVQSFAGWLVTVPEDITRRNDSPLQLDRESACRETYVCSQLTLTDDRGTHAEKKGPLHYVDLDRSEEDRKRLAKSGQRAGSRSCTNAYVPVNRDISRTSRSRTHEQARMSSRTLRECVCPKLDKHLNLMRRHS